MAFAACSWDRDSGCSASQPIDMDLERAPSMTSEKHPSSTTSCQSTVTSHEQITAGLKGQRKSYPKESSTGLRYQRPLEPAEAMWHKILCVYLDGGTVRNLSFNSIDLFPETEKEILRLLWERTKGHQIRDPINSALLFKHLWDRPDAIMFQVRLISPTVSVLIKLQTLMQDILKNLQWYIKEEGVGRVLFWRPCLPGMES